MMLFAILTLAAAVGPIAWLVRARIAGSRQYSLSSGRRHVRRPPGREQRGDESVPPLGSLRQVRAGSREKEPHLHVSAVAAESVGEWLQAPGVPITFDGRFLAMNDVVR